MKLGFVTAILAEDSLEEVLSTASGLGYDCVELMCWPTGKAERRYAGVTHLDVAGDSAEAVGQAGLLAEKYGITISGLGYYPNPLAADPVEGEKAASHLMRVIDAAAELGVNRVNSFIGRDPAKSIDDNWQPFLNRWGPLIEHAEKSDVKIGIENCPMFFTNDEWPGGKNLAISPAVWRRMFEAIPSPSFGLNYDPSHLVWMQMDYLEPLEEFKDRLFHVHAKDVKVDVSRLNDVGILANPLEYHSPKLPGRGDADWDRFFAKLRAVGYDGAVCVEVEDRDYENTRGDRVRALEECHQFLRPFVQA